MGSKEWADVPRPQRVMIITGAAVELVLTAVALTDLARRPADLVRGPKILWAAGCFVQPVGPVAYLILGRRPG